MILTFIDGLNFAMTMKLKCINHVSNRCGGVVSPRGGGALRCFRYRVCATGQGIVFTILALLPSQVSFSAKMLPKGYTLFKFLLPGRTTVYFLDPLLPDRVWFFAILLPDGGM